MNYGNSFNFHCEAGLRIWFADSELFWSSCIGVGRFRILGGGQGLEYWGGGGGGKGGKFPVGT